MNGGNRREIWVDNVKVIACILVVLGHFFQSMHRSGIIPDNAIHDWFDMTIYYFHVPLFFICSGYLYQKYSNVNSFGSWKTNVLKKLLALGIPYLFFSLATWVLKRLFASKTNIKIGGLFETLLIDPTPPYWYLYILFILFVITVTAKSRRFSIILLIAALICKLTTIFGVSFGIVAIDKTLENWIWFVLGMMVAEGNVHFVKKWTSMILMLLFIVLSVLRYIGLFEFRGVEFFLGLLICYTIISLMVATFKDRDQNRLFGIMSQYTMPVFLMHTLFAAPLRSILLKFGVSSPSIQVLAGIFFSFGGPVIAMIIMEKLKPLDFVVYPNRYLKIN